MRSKCQALKLWRGCGDASPAKEVVIQCFMEVVFGAYASALKCTSVNAQQPVSCVVWASSSFQLLFLQALSVGLATEALNNSPVVLRIAGPLGFYFRH